MIPLLGKIIVSSFSFNFGSKKILLTFSIYQVSFYSIYSFAITFFTAHTMHYSYAHILQFIFNNPP